MHIVQFSCGFANQLFELCFYEKLKKEHGPDAVYADLSFYEGNNDHGGFRLAPLYPLRYAAKVPAGCVRVHESEYFDAKFDEGHDYLYVGYWQDERFFPDDLSFIDEILHVNRLSPKNQAVLSRMGSGTSVSVHVRRGDFVNDHLHGNIATRAYFRNAVARMKELVPDPVFFVFSDDASWCRGHLDLGGSEVTFVTGNEEHPELDILMMSACRHHILSNSTFSWWGQRLSGNPDRVVIAPEYFYNEAIPGWDISGSSCFLRVRNTERTDAPCADPFFSILVKTSRPKAHYRRCLSSVLDQPFRGIEVLVPYDGSSGISGSVEAEYAGWDARIVPVREASASAARISAMRRAKGKYLLFLDSNDYLSENALEVLRDALQETPVDILGYSCCLRPGVRDVEREPPELTPDRIGQYLAGKCFHAVWGGCCSRTLIKTVLDAAGSRARCVTEDFSLAALLPYYAKSYRRIDDVVYYRIRYDDILLWAPPPSEPPFPEALASARAKWEPLAGFAADEAPDLLPLIRAGKAADAERLYRRAKKLYKGRPVLERLSLLGTLDRSFGTHFLWKAAKGKIRRFITKKEDRR